MTEWFQIDLLAGADATAIRVRNGCSGARFGRRRPERPPLHLPRKHGRPDRPGGDPDPAVGRLEQHPLAATVDLPGGADAGLIADLLAADGKAGDVRPDGVRGRIAR